MVKFKDYYQTLGISRQATDKEIKAQYRKLARQHHPDANKGNKASEEKFKEISEAYEVLRDPEKRRRYDTLGANWKAGADFRPPPDWGGFTFDFGNFGDLGKGSSFSDFFEVLFGQSFGETTKAGTKGGFHAPGDRSRPSFNQEAEIELTVEELASGTTRTLQITAPGARTRTLEVKIPQGVRAGSKIRVPGEAGKSMPGAGDLYLKVKVKPHAYFTVEGDNLVCELELSPAQAVVGGEVTVKTIDGPVRIRVPIGTQSGRLLRLRGKGLPRVKDSHRGDQLVRTKIIIPHQLTEKERRLYEELAQMERNKASKASG